MYKDSHYVDSADNLAGVSLSSDMVFSYGWDMQLPPMTGDASRGYTFSIDVRGGSRLQGRRRRSAKKKLLSLEFVGTSLEHKALTLVRP